MNHRTEKFFIQTPVGLMECARDVPQSPLKGLALIAHPHPLYGGTMDNKVTQTMARAFIDVGCVALRMNFRGVGASASEHDHGLGETDDLYQLWRHACTTMGYAALPLYLGGFSFGTFVVARLVQRLQQEAVVPRRIVLVGTAAGKWDVPVVPAHTELIHGELDETIPLNAVFEWARPQQLAVTVLSGAEHFFHQRLVQLRQIITQAHANF